MPRRIGISENYQWSTLARYAGEYVERLQAIQPPSDMELERFHAHVLSVYQRYAAGIRTSGDGRLNSYASWGRREYEVPIGVDKLDDPRYEWQDGTDADPFPTIGFSCIGRGVR